MSTNRDDRDASVGEIKSKILNRIAEEVGARATESDAPSELGADLYMAAATPASRKKRMAIYSRYNKMSYVKAYAKGAYDKATYGKVTYDKGYGKKGFR